MSLLDLFNDAGREESLVLYELQTTTKVLVLFDGPAITLRAINYECSTKTLFKSDFNYDSDIIAEFNAFIRLVAPYDLQHIEYNNISYFNTKELLTAIINVTAQGCVKAPAAFELKFNVLPPPNAKLDFLDNAVNDKVRQWRIESNLMTWPTHCGDPCIVDVKTDWNYVALQRSCDVTAKIKCCHCGTALGSEDLKFGLFKGPASF
jgi:hypothetical protein